MKTLRVFSDVRLEGALLELLRKDVEPHEVVFPAKPAASVLAKSEHDPVFDTADAAFGQPEVSSVLGSPKLRWLHLSSAGYTRFDTPEFRAAAKERGLIVTNSSTVYAEPCAEQVFSFMMAQARCLPAGLASRCANGSPEWMELRRSSVSPRGQHAVILGYGAIAAKLVAMMRPFDMRITALRRKARGDEGVPVITEEQLPGALAQADHVINILPDNAETVGFFSRERFASIKQGAVFYNIGRGTTVDQQALADALHSRHLAAAWLDVTDPEPLPDGHVLLGAPNCHITPHLAGGHSNETEMLVRHFLGNFRRFVDGAPLQDRIM